ncbi:MAG: flagellar hook-associated protein FlgK, partial [Marinospirillum sp.]|uniref:flagellar hook-associated protein FlgK n=1 Tax=Marinospirillum sp. TaxID=2183934 RepID=UPI001A0CE682
MSDLLSLGLTGLRTSRNNLSVTGHNISNIDTPGYSRQRAIQTTNPPFGTGAGYLGTGSRTQTIERIVDQYTIHQVRVDTSRLKDNEAYLRNSSELDNLLSNENSALGTALNGFFEGIQSAANDPLSQPARQLVFSQADSVSQRFKTAQSRLTDQNNNLNTQLRTYTARINELAGGIGELNKQIQVYEGTRNQPPNDLFDRRDELLRELSQYVEVNVQEQDGRTVNVAIGNGIPLITGENVNKLEAVPGRNDKSRYEVYMMDNRGTRMHITNEIAGGEMGGVLRYRTDTLDPALNEIGRIALVFAGEFNNQHHAGTDLQGNQGGDFFKDINTKEFMLDRITGIQRTAPAGVWLDPQGLNKLPAQEFMLR